MKTEINLMPNKSKYKTGLAKKRQMLRIAAYGSMFILCFLSIVIFILIAFSPLNSLREREGDESKKLSFFNEIIVKLELTKDRVSGIDKILSKRPSYSATIDKVSALLPAEMVTEEVQINQDILSITLSSPTLTLFDQFIENLKNEIANSKSYKKITIVTMRKDIENGKYLLTLELI